LEVDDLTNNMETIITNWKRLSKVVMANSHFHHHYNGPTYKNKWVSLYGDYKKIHEFQSVTCHNEKYWDMFAKYRVSQGLPIFFSIMFFGFINIFMNSIPCFNPSHSKDFMNPNDDVYHAIFFHDFSTCENLGFNEKLNCEEAMERNASPFATHDPISHYVKTLEEGNNWAIPSNLHIVGHNTPINFAFPQIGLKIIVIARAWQSPILVQPTFPNPIVNNSNVEGEPPTSNPIAK
jgi:hypothetical protein